MPKEAFYFLIPNNCAITPITCFNYTLVVQIITIFNYEGEASLERIKVS
jgi:hypothetical protein